MARTITTELFKFAELSPEAKAKAIENYREQLKRANTEHQTFPVG